MGRSHTNTEWWKPCERSDIWGWLVLVPVLLLLWGEPRGYLRVRARLMGSPTKGNLSQRDRWVLYHLESLLRRQLLWRYPLLGYQAHNFFPEPGLNTHNYPLHLQCG